jgi:hypothetical protein
LGFADRPSMGDRVQCGKRKPGHGVRQLETATNHWRLAGGIVGGKTEPEGGAVDMGIDRQCRKATTEQQHARGGLRSPVGDSK